MTFGGTITRQGQKNLPASMAALAGALLRGRLLVASTAAYSAALAKQLWRAMPASTAALSAALMRGCLFVAATAAYSGAVVKVLYRNVATATMTAFSVSFSMIRYWVVSVAASTVSMAGGIVKMLKRAISAS